MAWFLFLLVNVTLFLRPAEIVPAVEALPIYEVLIIGAFLGALPQLQRQMGPRALLEQPITLCVLGMLVSAVLSHVTHGDVQSTIESATILFKTILYYLILTALVTTPRRLRQLLLTVAISASTMVALCVVDYYGIVDFTFITHLTDWDDATTNTGEVGRIVRMRGPGIFQDPNDICVAIVMAGVLCTYFLTDRGQGSVRVLWLVPLGFLGMGLLCTQSRGGLLAAGSALIIWPLLRYGRTAAIVFAVLGVCAMPLVAKRQANIGLGDGTGQDRIQLWAEGLTEIKSPQILFGIGMNKYTEIAELVAHNSFVHAYVELGFFGGTLFFGCFFFAATAVYRLLRAPPAVLERLDPDLVRFAPFLAAILLATTVGLFSLSRCYVVPTYLVFGLAAAFINLTRFRRAIARPIVAWNQFFVTRLVGSSGVLLAGLFVFTRLFARF